MREHGYIDGQNVTFLERWAEGRSERFPELIEELISLKADVILAPATPARGACKLGETRLHPSARPIAGVIVKPL
jgi:putative tryptophan/tyrosine transport system substrate-binding protein